MFKKRTNKANRRKRRDSIEDDENDQVVEIVKADRTKRHDNPNKMSSKKESRVLTSILLLLT